MLRLVRWTFEEPVAASYGGGVVASFPVAAHGLLESASSVLHQKGIGPDKARQESSHVHWVQADVKNRFAYCCDLGSDEVTVHRFSSRSGTLSPTISAGNTPPGSGPRHAVFSKDSRFLYVNTEMGNSVTVFRVRRGDGSLRPLQTVPTYDERESLKGRTTAEIIMHPTGKWVYVSNRGADSISIFRVLRSGRLRMRGIQKLRVREPRSIALDGSGRWLVAAGQSSNNLETLSVNSKSGLLRPVSKPVSVDSPACVLFLSGHPFIARRQGSGRRIE